MSKIRTLSVEAAEAIADVLLADARRERKARLEIIAAIRHVVTPYPYWPSCYSAYWWPYMLSHGTSGVSSSATSTAFHFGPTSTLETDRWQAGCNIAPDWVHCDRYDFPAFARDPHTDPASPWYSAFNSSHSSLVWESSAYTFPHCGW